MQFDALGLRFFFRCRWSPPSYASNRRFQSFERWWSGQILWFWFHIPSCTFRWYLATVSCLYGSTHQPNSWFGWGRRSLISFPGWGIPFLFRLCSICPSHHCNLLNPFGVSRCHLWLKSALFLDPCSYGSHLLIRIRGLWFWQQGITFHASEELFHHPFDSIDWGSSCSPQINAEFAFPSPEICFSIIWASLLGFSFDQSFFADHLLPLWLDWWWPPKNLFDFDSRSLFFLFLHIFFLCCHILMWFASSRFLSSLIRRKAVLSHHWVWILWFRDS